MRKVAGIVGPEVYDDRPHFPGLEGPVICMQFISGHQRALNQVHEQDMHQLGGVLQRLHALPVEDLSGWAPTDRSLTAYAKERWREHLAARLPAIRDPLERALQRRLRAAVALVSDSMNQLTRTAVATDETLVLLHADVSGANVIWAPGPVLIDWEYARLGDPADEIGYLFTQNDLGDAHRAAFWRGYADRTAEAKLHDIIERVRQWEPMTLLGSIMWWLDAWSRSEPGESLPKEAAYYLLQAMQRLDRFERMFES
jgi:thiamine kinase-like enzyme